MSLEELYNSAANGTYVNKVRTTQAADVGEGRGVNFMDGTARTSPNNAADQFQNNFMREDAGANVIGGAQGTLRNPTQNLTRWTDKSFKLAFENDGPVSLANGYYYTNRFRTAITPKGTTEVHAYTPLNDGGYISKNPSAKIRYNANAFGQATVGAVGGTSRSGIR
jgi:hypothetical protein